MAVHALQGDKNLVKFEGDHNSPRPQFYFNSINIFFQNVLQPPEDEVGESFFDFMNDYFGKVKIHHAPLWFHFGQNAKLH